MERPVQVLGNDVQPRSEPSTTTTNTEVDETISQDHTDNNKVDPLTRTDTEEESVQQHQPTSPRNGYDFSLSPSTISRKSSEDPMDIPKDSIQGSEYESLREIMKSIPGLEFYRDRDYCRVVDFLLATIAKLKVENTTLKKEINDISVQRATGDGAHANYDEQTIASKITKATRYDVIHQVNCSHHNQLLIINYFRDAPLLFKGDTAKDHLRGRVQIQSLVEHFKEHTDVAFIVIRVHSCGQSRTTSSGTRNGRLIADSEPTESIFNTIALRPSLVLALKKIMNHHPSHFEGFDSERMLDRFREPSMFFYVHNKTLLQLSQSSGLDAYDRNAVQLLYSYFEEKCRGDWDEADHLFSMGKVNKKHVNKLFRPGELLLTKSKDGQEIITAKQVRNWAINGVGTLEWQFNGHFKKLNGFISSEKIFIYLFNINVGAVPS